MKKILFSILVLTYFAAPAFSDDGGNKLSSFGFSFGCFVPQDKNYEDIYGDEREVSFALYYDTDVSKSLALGTSLMYFDDEGTGVSSSLVQSATATDFKLVKAELSAIYRVIRHDDQLIVPEIKAGISGTYFNEKITSGKRTENVYVGYHAGFALLLLLDRLDTDYAKKLKSDFSIENTYLFIMADYSNTEDIDDNKLDLSGIEYSVGLQFRY